MLSTSPHHHHQPIYPSVPLLLRPYLNSAAAIYFPSVTTIPNRSTTRTISSCSSHNHTHRNAETQQQNPEPSTLNSHENQGISRKHNSKSTSLLLRHLSGQPPPCPDLQQPEEHSVFEEDRLRLLEMSLVRKRTPQFPGSIYIQSPGDVDVNSSLPPLRKLVGAGDDEDMLLKALEIRRRVTVEIFKEAMKRGKFGITYYTNMVEKLPDFIDYVMIKAASLKQLPEYSQSSFNVRARTVIDESNVVPMIRWLKHNAVSYPQIAKLICMSKRNLDAITQVTGWLKSTNVKGGFIGVALLKSGENIFTRGIEELDEIVDYLESRGVRREWMGYVISRCPQILSFSMEEVKLRAHFYLDMGMNENDFGTMVFDYPRVLGYFSMEEMNRKVAYLGEFGLSKEDIGKLLAFKPQLMGCSIEERWKPLVKYLYYLGISKDGMRRMLTIKPMVFCVDLESTIVPKVRFLRDIGVREDAIGNMLVKFPPLLTYSLFKKIRPVVIFLLTKAGLTQRDIGKVVALSPELLGCSIANKLDLNVKYFLSLGIRLQLLGEMIADFPMLLRYNADILRPKYRYLRRIMVRPLRDVIEFPRFFSYSLEGRIVPRHTIMVENRVNFKLRYMLADTDEEFEQRVRDAVERRRRFESGIPENDPFEDESDGSTQNASVELPVEGHSSSLG